MARLAARLQIAAACARQALVRNASATWPAATRRILIVHRLLLGDTLMLTALVKKLRAQHPQADIVLTMQRAFLPLYAGRPYGVLARAFDPHEPASVRAIIDDGPYDVGIVPGDNRHSWLAYAAGCRHIVAHAGDRPGWKNWPLDDRVPYAAQPATWAAMTAELAPGPAPAPFAPADWPAPAHRPFAVPSRPYAVLHVGASNPLRTWFAPRWAALAAQLSQAGLQVVWSAGGAQAERALVAAADPQQRHQSLAGQLDLAQLWHLLAQAQLLVCPETGVAHLARLTDTPSVVLYGQGSDVLFGGGHFWHNARQHALIEPVFPCRDQHHLFRRELQWVRRCDRRPPACSQARCMEGLTVERVLSAARAHGWLS